jgi:L-rhamnonate dehydratase
LPFSFNRALELCKLIEPYKITWFEEPVYQNGALLLADLRRHTSIPIAAGQNEGHRFRHRELIVNRGVDIAQPNVCSVGGYTETVKVAALAQAFNLPIANGGGWPDHNMHLQAAMSNGWRVEFHFETCGYRRQDLQRAAGAGSRLGYAAGDTRFKTGTALDTLNEFEEK